MLNFMSTFRDEDMARINLRINRILHAKEWRGSNILKILEMCAWLYPYKWQSHIYWNYSSEDHCCIYACFKHSCGKNLKQFCDKLQDVLKAI